MDVRLKNQNCECENSLTVVSPQIGEREAVCRCRECGKIFVMDSQPSSPANFPAKERAGKILVVDLQHLQYAAFAVAS